MDNTTRNRETSAFRRGLIGLAMMVLLAVLVIFGSRPLYDYLDGIGGEKEPAGERYYGTADGYGGPVNVVVIVDDGKIVDVTAEGNKETQGIGSKALEQLPDVIVKYNTAEVDTISGATVTSEALIYAVRNAMNPEDYPYPVK